jgi:predicted hotdog family 3-hydroxylacyl-ACP dehydratase
MTFRPVAVAWFLAVGIDLFFNAGLFSGLFDQTREPGLLPDAVLAGRVGVAYAALAIAVAALAWLLDRTDRRGALAGAVLGARAGLVFATMGIVMLWTAIDMTGIFVAAGALVQVVEMAGAGAVLGAFRTGADRRRLTRRVLVFAVLAAAGGIVLQNIM